MKFRTRMMLGPLEDPGTLCSSLRFAFPPDGFDSHWIGGIDSSWMAGQAEGTWEVRGNSIWDRPLTDERTSWKILITQGVEMGRRSEIEVNVKIAEGGVIESIQLGGSVCEVMEGNIVVPKEGSRRVSDARRPP